MTHSSKLDIHIDSVSYKSKGLQLDNNTRIKTTSYELYKHGVLGLSFHQVNGLLKLIHEHTTLKTKQQLK